MEALSASDLFICEGKSPAARIHGSLNRLDAPPTTPEAVEELLNWVLRDEQRQRFDSEGDLDAGFSLPGGQRFRLNLSMQQGRRAIVARAVPVADLSFEDLGLPEAVSGFADSPRGLVLVTGATGSGKSTTLAAMIHRINSTRRAHIVTLEDPIEFVHRDRLARVSQREVGTDTRSFSTALKEIVRQSPDVIMIGELRDAETMRVAVSAALTGHLVLATMHTIDATQSLQRILSYFADHLRAQVAMDLSMSLQGIISQRLLPRADESGRVVAVEVMTATPSVAKLLREQRVDELYDLMRSSTDPGLMTFNKSLLQLYRAEVITYDVGHAYASNPEEFALQARGMSTGLFSFQGSETDGSADLDMKGLLNQVLARGASDLHLTSGRPPILRISGELVTIGDTPLSDADMRILLYSILSGRQRSIYELEREIDFALALDRDQRFRVNAYYQKGRMAAALRAIPRKVPSAEELGLPPQLLRLGNKPHGLLLVVGPTGSGKSTTLACLLDRINRSRACRIITVEDPIEYAHEGAEATIDQREIGADTKSFAAALKYILRQDPDVILVGEMRDLETVSAALTVAETGHLVLATLHANDAIQAIDRMIDVFPAHQQAQARSMLSAALLGVVSQRLLPHADGGGRVAVFEIMVANPAIRNLVRENKMHQAKSIMESGRRDGMVTLDKALEDLYRDKMITYETALRYISNPRKIPAPGTDGTLGQGGGSYGTGSGSTGGSPGGGRWER
jgi:twitching motility protein PilT